MGGSSQTVSRTFSRTVWARTLAVLAAAACLSGLVPARAGADTPAVAVAPAPAGSDAGLVPADRWRERQDDYLHAITSGPVAKGSPLSLVAHAERAAREPGYDGGVATAQPEDFAPIFAKLAAFADTGDFDVNDLLTLVLRYRSALSPALAAAVEERVLAFKYWWTEPTPPGVVDSQYYWTENHQIIYLANEYVAGQAFPEATFTNSGMTGAEHVAHAEPRIRRWLELRARFGFSEWLSNVYWMEDLEGLLLLAEFAGDAWVRQEASMMLDVMFVELAEHLHKGSFGSTHGRSYMKDKLSGRDDDTFNLAKMVFDRTPPAYTGIDGATLVAVAARYRPPEVARRIAASAADETVRQHQSLPLDPLAPVSAAPVAPYGLTFEGEDGLMTWWAMGAQLPWQMAPTSAKAMEDFGLWQSSNFRQAGALEPIVKIATPQALRLIARFLAVALNPGLLSEVDTSTWRSSDVMLSAAQDWRPGQRSEQAHVWQATLDTEALVFTNHPRTGVPSLADPEKREGYWTGEAALPRVAHHGRTLVAVYAPQYPSLPFGGESGYGFGYEPYTHAFFPTERFDSVVERDGWVIGRRGDGYVALWSWRPARWRDYDAATEFTRGLSGRFDLVARGGADDVWITEVGRAADYPGASDPFAAFVDAVTAAKPAVRPYAGRTPCPPLFSAPGAFCLHWPWDGFTVKYRSPSEGEVSFGFTPRYGRQPFVVDGAEVDLHPPPRRWDATYSRAAWDSGVYDASADGWGLHLDFGAALRDTATP
ncbi:MAG: hypothetical protein U0U69_11825 [Acidimicrobiia bacterium]